MINKNDLLRIDAIFENILRRDTPTSSQLQTLKTELNRFYKGNNQCKSIIYTRNTDKSFFGMCVYPNVNPSHIQKTFTGSIPQDRSNYDYVIEFDSKIFDPLVGFTARELTAMLMHEIGHIVVDEINNAEKISKFVNEYIAYKDSSLSNSDFSKSANLLEYAYNHTIRRLNSIFDKNQEEFEADRFSIDMGYGADLESAFVKIIRAKGITRPSNPFGVLLWSLTTYNQLFKRKKFIYKVIDSVNEYSGSQLEKKSNNDLKEKLRTDFNKSLNENTYILKDQNEEAIRESFGMKVKTAGLKAIEDEAFIYSIKIKNVDNEIEAVKVMRDLNEKINIVTDFLQLNKDLSDSDVRRWNLLLEKLLGLREALSKSESYKPKYYGLFVQMPVTQSRY